MLELVVQAYIYKKIKKINKNAGTSSFSIFILQLISKRLGHLANFKELGNIQ
jgi:predicted CopG family antitoxin